MAQVEVALDCRALLGESPVCTPSGVVHFADIEGCAIHTFYPSTNSHTVVATGGRKVGCVVPCSGSAIGRPEADIIASFEDGVVAVDSSNGVCGLPHLASFPAGHLGPQFRSNDGKCDPRGRLWVGTMNTEVHRDAGAFRKGRLYCIQKGRLGPPGERAASESAPPLPGQLEVVEKLRDVRCSNGLEWDGARMFFIDSFQQSVDVFDYDQETGEVGNRRTAVTIPAACGFPDGMTVDAGGKLWVALWRGGCVKQFDPTTGRELTTVALPARFPTSVCFGGGDLSELYVTSSAEPDDGSGPDVASEKPGALFRVRIPGVRGASYSRSFTG